MKFKTNLLCLTLFTLALPVSSEDKNFKDLNFYLNILGQNTETFISSNKDHSLLVSIPDHDPGTYTKVIRLEVDKDTYQLIKFDKNNIIDAISISVPQIKTKEGIGLGSFYCDVLETYPNLIKHQMYDGRVGEAINLTNSNNTINYIFGKPRDIDLQFYTPEVAQCNEKLISIDLLLKSK